MPLKTHLLVIAAIVAVLFLIWKVLTPPDGATSASSASSSANAQAIIVVRASWGANCANRVNSPPLSAYTDNIKEGVSTLCNGKSACSIPVTRQMLSPDPFPQCADKELEVEYRCFSYDRLQTARASNGTLAIACKPSDSAAP